MLSRNNDGNTLLTYRQYTILSVHAQLFFLFEVYIYVYPSRSINNRL